jgi:acetolactate synthase regulatory subunit
MEWTYKITAAANPRVLLRVLQLFEQQRLSARSIVYTVAGGAVTILMHVHAEADHAGRIQAKLHNQHDIREVELTPAQDEPKPLS